MSLDGDVAPGAVTCVVGVCVTVAGVPVTVTVGVRVTTCGVTVTVIGAAGPGVDDRADGVELCVTAPTSPSTEVPEPERPRTRSLAGRPATSSTR